MILCSDDSLYTGISTNVERRFQEHLSQRGAKYFRGREPLKIVYLASGFTRSTASKKEAAIKLLSREEKLALISMSRI